MNVIPLGDRVIVRPSEGVRERERTDTTVDPTEDRPTRGIVIAAGTGSLNARGESVPLAVQAGDTVLFVRHRGRRIAFGGMHCWILEADDIVKVEARGAMPLLRGESDRRRP